MSIITHIGTAVPPHKHLQSDIQHFMLNISDGSENDKRKTRMMYARSGINTRYSTIPDYSCAIEDRTFYPKTVDLEPFPAIKERLDAFENHAAGLAKKAIENAFENHHRPEFTHLITVSCTGLSAPGLDIELVKNLNLNSEINRTSVNFMGCYAAIHAFKQADVICQSNRAAKVLIVLVELCTLHFQKENSLDFITSNLLFGDGAACCLVQNEGSGFSIEGFYSKLFLDAESSMAWHVSPSGFLMTLKSDVPEIIKENLKGFVENSLSKNKVSKIHNWVIHPGGKGILEASERALGLEKQELQLCYEVLKNYGNMSSCTIVFILKLLRLQNQETSLVTGFGPGITMESMILKTIV